MLLDVDFFFDTCLPFRIIYFEPSKLLLLEFYENRLRDTMYCLTRQGPLFSSYDIWKIFINIDSVFEVRRERRCDDDVDQ